MTEKEFLQKVLNAVRLILISENEAIELILKFYDKSQSTNQQSNSIKKANTK